jgi:SAM-dependent methyltransferase
LKQTPAHEVVNADLLALMPAHARRVVEVGCSLGAFAGAYKATASECHYTGIEIDGDYAEASKRFCDRVVHASIEALDDAAFASLFPSDCWVFGDTLEHLQDPWRVLRRIRSRITPGGCVVACIPNAQHWSVQARLNSGQFRYEDSGLLDRTHLRWFTRLTIGEMFDAAGFTIVEGGARTFDEPGREKVLEAIRTLARAVGADPEQAASDARALQWVVRAETR